MSDLKPWEYWKEPNYPKHEGCCDGWNGPDSDPDHCVTRCEDTIKWLASEVVRLRRAPDAEKERAAANWKVRAIVTLQIARDELDRCWGTVYGGHDNPKLREAAGIAFRQVRDFLIETALAAPAKDDGAKCGCKDTGQRTCEGADRGRDCPAPKPSAGKVCGECDGKGEAYHYTNGEPCCLQPCGFCRGGAK